MYIPLECEWYAYQQLLSLWPSAPSDRDPQSTHAQVEQSEAYLQRTGATVKQGTNYILNHGKLLLYTMYLHRVVCNESQCNYLRHFILDKYFLWLLEDIRMEVLIRPIILRTRALLITYSTHSICTDLVSKTLQQQSGSMGTMSADNHYLSYWANCVHVQRAHDPISRCGRQAWEKMCYLWCLWLVQNDLKHTKASFFSNSDRFVHFTSRSGA